MTDSMSPDSMTWPALCVELQLEPELESFPDKDCTISELLAQRLTLEQVKQIRACLTGQPFPTDHRRRIIIALAAAYQLVGRCRPDRRLATPAHDAVCTNPFCRLWRTGNIHD